MSARGNSPDAIAGARPSDTIAGARASNAIAGATTCAESSFSLEEFEEFDAFDAERAAEHAAGDERRLPEPVCPEGLCRVLRAVNCTVASSKSLVSLSIEEFDDSRRCFGGADATLDGMKVRASLSIPAAASVPGAGHSAACSVSSLNACCGRRDSERMEGMDPNRRHFLSLGILQAKAEGDAIEKLTWLVGAGTLHGYFA